MQKTLSIIALSLLIFSGINAQNELFLPLSSPKDKVSAHLDKQRKVSYQQIDEKMMLALRGDQLFQYHFTPDNQLYKITLSTDFHRRKFAEKHFKNFMEYYRIRGGTVGIKLDRKDMQKRVIFTDGMVNKLYLFDTPEGGYQLKVIAIDPELAPGAVDDPTDPYPVDPFFLIQNNLLTDIVMD